MERISKFLASTGLSSRREAEKYVLDGRIKINDELVRDLGRKIDPEIDIVKIDDTITKPEKKVYYLLNKPCGYTVTNKDIHAEKTYLELLPKEKRLFAVGRLDKETSGLLLATNDGDLALSLTHPKFEKEKEYEVAVESQISNKNLKKLEIGVEIENKKTSTAKISFTLHKNNKFYYNVTITEGRNRQIRKMFDFVGHIVLELCRVRFDFLTLEGLKEGNYRPLTPKEIEKLKK